LAQCLSLFVSQRLDIGLSSLYRKMKKLRIPTT
jgi:hypothetical protein